MLNRSKQDRAEAQQSKQQMPTCQNRCMLHASDLLPNVRIGVVCSAEFTKSNQIPETFWWQRSLLHVPLQPVYSVMEVLEVPLSDV